MEFKYLNLKFGLLFFVIILLSYIVSGASATWIPTTATHSVDGNVLSLVNADDTSYSRLDHQEYIDVTSWDKSLSGNAANLNVIYKFIVVSPTNDFEIHVDIVQPFVATNVCVIDPNGAGGTYSCNLTAAGIDTVSELNNLDVRLRGIENPLRKAPDYGYIDYIYLNINYNPIPSNVNVKTYSDSSYSKEFKFFDRTDTVYTEATVSNWDGSLCSNCNVNAYFKINGLTEKTLSLNHIGNGVYRNYWSTNDSTTNGIYLVNVTASNSIGSASGNNKIHIYSGNDIAAYNINYNNANSNDYVLENKHLVVVFQESDPISLIYQKDTGEKYYFNSIADPTTNGGGGIDSSEGKGFMSNLLLSDISENLNEATLYADVSYSDVGDNELLIGDDAGNVGNFSLYNESFSLLWGHDNPYFGAWTSTLTMGDVDNDGYNEFIAADELGDDLVIYDYNVTNNSYYPMWYKNLTSTGSTIDGPVVGTIDDFDNDGYNEFLVGGNSASAPRFLYIYENDTTGATEWSRTTLLSGSISVFSIGSHDFDGDNYPEIFHGSNSGGTISVLEYNGSAYLNIYNISGVGAVDDMGFGNVDSDSDTEIIVCGNNYKVQVLKYNSGTGQVYVNWNSSVYSAYVQSCGTGDFDGDDIDEFYVGENGYNVDVYDWNGTSWYVNWTTPQSGSVNMKADFAGDFDNDGSDEFGIKIGSTTFFVYQYNNTAGYYVQRNFTARMGLVGDFDNDGAGGGASLKTSILMNSEDADYLLYKMYDMNSESNKDIYSVISGTIGGNVNDDRYHLENGADGLITSLSSGQWNNYVNSDYSAVYDSSTSSDNANDNIISWIRYEESSSNINFKDVGLWNGNNNEGLRIKYEFNSTFNSTNYGTYLLAFTKGNYNVIDQWISTIKTGILPVNFMTAPQNGSSSMSGAGAMNVNLDAPISGSNFNSNTSFTANATIDCLDGECGYVDTKLQYCEGISCDNWVDVTELTDLSTSLTTKHCSDNLLSNNQCIVSWDVNGNVYGTYRLNVLALSNVSIDARDETPNTVYINDVTIPYVLIVEPLDGSTVNGIVTIKADASDFESGISIVEYKIDEGNYILMNLVSGFYQSDWDTSQQTNELHYITVRAVDNANNTNTDSISVNVSNQQQLNNLQVSVITDKSSYTANEWVYSTTTVLDNLNNPVLNASVVTEFYAPNSQLKKTCNGLTDSNGIDTCNYKLKSNDPTGTWNVFSNATKQGYNPGSGFTTFVYT